MTKSITKIIGWLVRCFGVLAVTLCIIFNQSILGIGFFIFWGIPPFWLFAFIGFFFVSALGVAILHIFFLRRKPVSIQRIIAGVLQYIGIITALIIGQCFLLIKVLVPYMSPPPYCHEGGIVDSAVSPDDKWLAEVNDEACGLVPPETYYLTLRKTGEPQNLSYNARVFGLDNIEQMNVRWTDKNTLEVGVPIQGMDVITDVTGQTNIPIKDLPEIFRGVHIVYVPSFKKSDGK